MHLSLDGFVAGPQGEMDWIKVDEEIFDHIDKRISELAHRGLGFFGVKWQQMK